MRTYQVVMPLDLGMRIPGDDSVRALIEVTERMDYSRLNRAYERREEAGEATPKQMFQLVLLGFMNGIYSTRKLCKACECDLRFIWILAGRKVPSHNRFARFVRERLQGQVMEDLFYQLVRMLNDLGEITGENVFVDGTKIEANANRYSFVWQKRLLNSLENLMTKQEALLNEIRSTYLFELAGVTEAEDVQKALREMLAASGQPPVREKRKRRTKLQRYSESLDEVIERRRSYENSRRIMGARGSYSKTDHDATFMRMKEDHLGNGQLKPAYNVQLAVEGEYIVGLDAVSERNDVHSLIPLLKKTEKGSGIKHRNVVADAGYESEENYTFLEKNGQVAYIKPQNYEKSKTRRFRKNPYLRENMPYDEGRDAYLCPAGKWLTHKEDRERKTKSGFVQQVSVYVAENCEGCPMKGSCTKAKEERIITVSKRFIAQREAAQKRIASEQGRLLRINRSIQSEGVFGVLKQDWRFRRFLRRGAANVTTELTLYAFAFNVCKLHQKMLRQRTQSQLIYPSTAWR